MMVRLVVVRVRWGLVGGGRMRLDWMRAHVKGECE